MNRVTLYRDTQCLKHNDYNRETFRPKEIGDVYKVSNRLYIGSYALGANAPHVLKDIVGITDIVTVGHNMPPKYPKDFNYHIFGSYDSERQDMLSEIWPKATQLIHQVLASSANNRVFVHCYAGISRASSTMMAYLMRYQSMDYHEAYEYLRQIRGWIRPNDGFKRQLKQWCAQLSTCSSEKRELYHLYDSVTFALREYYYNRASLSKEKKRKIISVFGRVFGAQHPYTRDLLRKEFNIW